MIRIGQSPDINERAFKYNVNEQMDTKKKLIIALLIGITIGLFFEQF